MEERGGRRRHISYGTARKLFTETVWMPKDYGRILETSDSGTQQRSMALSHVHRNYDCAGKPTIQTGPSPVEP